MLTKKIDSDAKTALDFALRKDLSMKATNIYLEYIAKSDSIWRTASDLVNAVFWNNDSEIQELSKDFYKKCISDNPKT